MLLFIINMMTTFIIIIIIMTYLTVKVALVVPWSPLVGGQTWVVVQTLVAVRTWVGVRTCTASGAVLACLVGRPWKGVPGASCPWVPWMGGLSDIGGGDGE